MTIDSVGNSLSLIRNANLARHSGVSLPFSNANVALAKILTRSGFCRGWRVVPKNQRSNGHTKGKQADFGFFVLKSGPKKRVLTSSQTANKSALVQKLESKLNQKRQKTVLKEIQLGLKYVGLYARPVLTGCKQISRPSLRCLRGQRRLATFNVHKHGLTIVSTNRGLMTHQEARKQRLGGEILFSVW